MKVTATKLPDCLLITPQRFNDHRGFFQEAYRQSCYQQMGIDANLVQDNWSRSFKNVLRGLHFQRTNPQGKLVSVLRGEIFDVMVDIRPQSVTFSQWQGVYLTEQQAQQLWVPPGFAHGFLVISDTADVLYKTSAYYNAADEGSICWNDADLAIEWPCDEPVLSAKDAAAPSFAQAVLPFAVSSASGNNS